MKKREREDTNMVPIKRVHQVSDGFRGNGEESILRRGKNNLSLTQHTKEELNHL